MDWRCKVVANVGLASSIRIGDVKTGDIGLAKVVDKKKR